jgi:Holliday junction resolvase
LQRDSIRRRGFEAERELVRKLWRKGFAVVRAPASGAKAKRIIYPDVVAIYQGRVLVFEVKTRSKLEAIYIEGDKVLKLKEFARRAGGEAFIAVKIKGEGWYFIPLEALNYTGKHYRLDAETIKEQGLRFEELISRIVNSSLEMFGVRSAG